MQFHDEPFFARCTVNCLTYTKVNTANGLETVSKWLQNLENVSNLLQKREFHLNVLQLNITFLRFAPLALFLALETFLGLRCG